MPEPLNDDHQEILRLTEQMRDIEKRLAALEKHEARGGLLSRMMEEAEAQSPQPQADAAATTLPDLQLQTGMFAIAGRAVLGIAGAYLLRALADSGSAPKVLVVTAAVLYAAAWLVAAMRTREGDELAGAVYAFTSAAILTPLLWEATIKFGIFSSPVTATLLATFAVLGELLAWRKNQTAIPVATTLAALAGAFALTIGTGDVTPYAAAILAIALTIELTTIGDHWRNLRPIAALTADFSIWLMVFLHARPGGVPESYHGTTHLIVIAFAAALALIYLASTLWRALLTKTPVTIFEAVQLALAFAMPIAAAFLLEGAAAALPLGLFCTAAGIGAYAVAFFRMGEDYRTYQVFSTYGLLLSLTGTWLLLPVAALAVLWNVVAVLATARAERHGRWTLAAHAGLCIIAGWFVSGAAGWTQNALMGSSPTLPGPAILAVTAGTGACYWVWSRMAKHSRDAERTAEMKWMRWACLIAASFTVIMIAAVTATVAGWALSGGNPGASLMATVRMLVTCLTALGVGFAGANRRREELVWISYGAIALGSVKLLVEDFRQSSPTALALSLLCYGAVLILVPRMKRSGIH